MELIRNARVFAPRPLGIVDILIAGEKIELIQPGIEIPESLLSQTIDLDGRSVVPGLIEGHAHVTGGGGEAGARSRVPRQVLTDFTAAGVTTVVGLLGTDDITRSTEELLATTRALNEEGITAMCHTGGYHIPPRTLTGSVASDIVNIEVVIGIGEVAISDHRSSQPTLEELLRIASQVHVAGMMTEKAGIMHLHVGDGPAGLELIRRAIAESEIPARVFNPTHVNRRKQLFEEATDLASTGSTVDVTSFPVAGDEDAWPAWKALELYWERGLPTDKITVSSDCGGCLPEFDSEGRIESYEIGESHSLVQTLQTLIENGHPVEAVLPPFTTNQARLLRRETKGELRVGADADLVVVEDPFKITDVMARGRWHIRAGKRQITGTFEK